jgi:spore maturation protein CgeB
MKILYIGQNYGTSLQRCHALKRIGHDPFLIDPYAYLHYNKFVAKWIQMTGAFAFSTRVKSQILENIQEKHFDLAWIDAGAVCEPDLIMELKNKFGFIINYNNDDPFPLKEYGDYNKWRLYRKSIPYYDLLAVVREQNVKEVNELGCKNVLHVFRSADEIHHKPVVLNSDEIKRWKSEVCFVGTWMPERGPFIARLLKKKLPLSIWGDRWHKSAEWNLIKPHWKGPGVFNTDYSKIIQSSKICLGLLSIGNRDLHTQRSVEIPAIGGLLCAKRSTEHLQMYTEGQEAVFWDNADECANMCLELLKSPNLRDEIARRGHARCLTNNYFNEPTLKHILEKAYEIGLRPG